ncbi:DUF6197 family protein [Streptomyces sp. WM6349]|uniref:DUF6197 family protein n=1 Tax=Streptomyces sp. WM6349 TaxID=1415552 RepID=UPI0006B05D36|nr:hypothetical protein [Streptomyces sp. WM6349]KOU17030.1 hypothetical protein ADK49_16965 [Streptomyces sp. WM6349]
MTTATAAAPTRAAAPALTLDDRLALSLLTMDDRLAQAGADHLIRTAAIDLPEILVDQTPAAAPAAPTTAEEVLQQAGRLIAAHGWIRGYVGSQATGYCLIGAIRTAASGNSRLEDGAEQLILDRIRAEQPDVLSAGAWNDAQTGPDPVIRMLTR